MSGPIYRLDRRDSAEPEVVAVFLKAGATVVRHSGRDEPDLFVGYRGVWHAVEVKTDRAGLRPDVPGLHRPGRGAGVRTVRRERHLPYPLSGGSPARRGCDGRPERLTRRRHRR